MNTYLGHIELCRECNAHGHIVDKQGDISPEFTSKSEGNYFLDLGFQVGYIDQQEVLYLRERLLETALPDSSEDVDPQLKRDIHNWNKGVSLNPISKPSIQEFHRVVEWAREHAENILNVMEKLKKRDLN